jgi:hypothetical protein
MQEGPSADLLSLIPTYVEPPPLDVNLWEISQRPTELEASVPRSSAQAQSSWSTTTGDVFSGGGVIRVGSITSGNVDVFNAPIRFIGNTFRLNGVLVSMNATVSTLKLYAFPAATNAVPTVYFAASNSNENVSAVKPTESDSETRLISLIDGAGATTILENESATTANSAVADAKYLLSRNQVQGEPLVFFGDDGILTLQWQRHEYGVALLFAGDGEVSIAFKKPGQRYAQNGIDLPIGSELPDLFKQSDLAIVRGSPVG